MSISHYGGRPCSLSGFIDCWLQETTQLSASLNPENGIKYSHMYIHTRTQIQINQWGAGGMRHKIFTSNEYSAESSFVSSPTTVLQLNIYGCLNKWNKAHNLNTTGVLLRVKRTATPDQPVSLHGYAPCQFCLRSWFKNQPLDPASSNKASWKNGSRTDCQPEKFTTHNRLFHFNYLPTAFNTFPPTCPDWSESKALQWLLSPRLSLCAVPPAEFSLFFF